MRTWKAIVVAFLCLSLPVFGQPLPRVRPLDEVAAAALARGLEESARFRALVDELDASDVIVHVVATPTLPHGLLGMMRFVGRRGRTRYVRIDLRSLGSPDQRTATLAHELQHACEVARADVASHIEVRMLYREIGHGIPGAYDSFETEDARAAGAEVWSELRQTAAATTDQ
jgi:hypothetical protein